MYDIVVGDQGNTTNFQPTCLGATTRRDELTSYEISNTHSYGFLSPQLLQWCTTIQSKQIGSKTSSVVSFIKELFPVILPN